MMEVVDGEYQTMKARDGAYVREHFFGKYPELAAMVANWSNDDIFRLNRGGHDPHKVYAAYHAAVKHTGQPTVILAKTIKGYGMGGSGEAQNISHQQKKVDLESLRGFRDRFDLPIKRRADSKTLPYLKFEEGSKELPTCASGAWRSAATCHSVAPRPSRSTLPPLSAFDALLKASGEGRELSTTMAYRAHA
jgi:pyruvate dehydrogenase E1 component